MEQPTVAYGPEEVAEIERHKYFLSEEAGYDVGWEFAEKDWEENYGKKFRQVRADNGEGASCVKGPFLKRLLSMFTSKGR